MIFAFTSSLRNVLFGSLGIAALITATPGAASAQEAAEAEAECFIMYSSHEEITATIAEIGFSPENYDALCLRLEEEGLALRFDGESHSLDDRVVAWAAARLIRIDSEIASTVVATNTRMVAPEIPLEEALPLMQMAAVDAAMDRVFFDFNNHYEALQAEEVRLAAIFAQQES